MRADAARSRGGDPKEMQGRSWTPLFKDPKAEFRKDWLYEYTSFRTHRCAAARRAHETWKLIHYYDEPQEFELYDWNTSVGEVNLYGKPGQQERFLD